MLLVSMRTFAEQASAERSCGRHSWHYSWRSHWRGAAWCIPTMYDVNGKVEGVGMGLNPFAQRGSPFYLWAILGLNQ